MSRAYARIHYYSVCDASFASPAFQFAIVLVLLCAVRLLQRVAAAADWVGGSGFYGARFDRTVTLSQFKGQVVVLNFWATWCPPCIEEMPSLVQMQQRMKAKGITVLAVSVDVDESNYQRFLRDHNVNLLSVRDADQKSNALYGTFKFPETYVIDRNGVVRRKFIGAVDWTEPDVIEYLGKL